MKLLRALAKLGSARKPIPSGIFLEHRHEPPVVENSFVKPPVVPQSVNGENPEAEKITAVIELIQVVLMINPDWTLPFITYLLQEDFPENEVEAKQTIPR